MTTVITLFKMDEDYYVAADRDGAIQGDCSMESAKAKMRALGIGNPRFVHVGALLAYGSDRLFEMKTGFKGAASKVGKSVDGDNLYRITTAVGSLRWGYKLRRKIGEHWYEQAERL